MAPQNDICLVKKIIKIQVLSDCNYIPQIKKKIHFFLLIELIELIKSTIFIYYYHKLLCYESGNTYRIIT